MTGPLHDAGERKPSFWDAFEIKDAKPSGPAAPFTGTPTAHALKALDNECYHIAGLVEGTRDDALNRAAFNMGQLIGAGHIDEEMVLARLHDAGIQSGQTEAEVARALRTNETGGLTNGKLHPRLVPDLPMPPVTVLNKSTQTAPVLHFRSFADLACEVDARGPRQWLVRGIWPDGDYGVHGAEPKTGKTWNALDLAVSVASGTDWLGAFPIDTIGPVIVFAGEGGEGNLVRRVRAIAAARGIDADTLPLHVCTRAPRLSDKVHLDLMRAAVIEIGPVLVVIDPFYLAAGGANGADLYAMGELLEAPQHICQQAGSALMIVTHYNRSRDLKGAARLTGAGPAEWGRVLLAANAESRTTDPVTQATTVTMSIAVSGGEIADQTIRVRRTIQSADPDDLDAELNYQVDVLAVPDLRIARQDRPTTLMEKVSIAVETVAGINRNGIGDAVTGRKDYITQAITVLVGEGYIETERAPRNGRSHRSLRPYRQAEDPKSDYCTERGAVSEENE